MGSVTLKIGEGTAKFRSATFCSSAANILMLLSILITNLFALYAFTSTNHHHHAHRHHPPAQNLSLISHQVSLILHQINSSQQHLSRLQHQLLGYSSLDLSLPSLPSDLRSFLRPHPLPLGRDSRSGISHLTSSVAHSCSRSLTLLSQFSAYTPAASCPDDLPVSSKLLSASCDPLPRRRCFSRSVPKPHLPPLPRSLWTPPDSKSVIWNGFNCKSFECLNDKPVSEECVRCFDLVNGTAEKQRFVKARSKNDFRIDDVLGIGGGRVRVGLDLGGGSGTFAARMAERNVTVVTSAVNALAPFNEFIAARGLFPLHLSLDRRLPFHDGVFDLVRAGNGLGGASRKQEKLEFLMFDIDRVLREGGLFWLDNFHCLDDERKRAIMQLVESFKFKKLKLVVGEKGGKSGRGKAQVYLSALLQKPARR